MNETYNIVLNERNFSLDGQSRGLVQRHGVVWGINMVKKTRGKIQAKTIYLQRKGRRTRDLFRRLLIDNNRL